MIYKDLILNKKNWNRILTSVKKGKLSHALLFHGPPGSGKEGHAVELAAYLNCNDPLNEGACGNCSSCKKIRTFQHEDVHLIIPLPRGKNWNSDDPIDKLFRSKKILNEYLSLVNEKGENPYALLRMSNANTILINSVRNIKQEASLSSINNKWKIFLIFHAEKLCVPSPEAAHALLKILEEPPEKTIFIMVSSHPEAILDTIHSRCQKKFFPAISSSVIEEKLVQSGMDNIQAGIIAHISGGDMSLQSELVENSADILEKMYQFLNASFSSDPKNWEKCIDIVSRLKMSSPAKLEQLFKCIGLFIRDLLYYASTMNDADIVFKNQVGKISKIVDKHPDADWQQCLNQVELTQEYIKRNGYVPLVITNLIMDLQQSINGEFHEPFNLHEWSN
ncbi:MAG: DNA polymerase III subunit delta' [Candidatus Marinimicrobia bacterium]|nr:DNA polymerase III subunit delta' [Candidatus Neomarinimicrobiota bacterium]